MSKVGFSLKVLTWAIITFQRLQRIIDSIFTVDSRRFEHVMHNWTL